MFSSLPGLLKMKKKRIKKINLDGNLKNWKGQRLLWGSRCGFTGGFWWKWQQQHNSFVLSSPSQSPDTDLFLRQGVCAHPNTQPGSSLPSFHPKLQSAVTCWCRGGVPCSRLDETFPNSSPTESSGMRNSGSKPFPSHYWWPADPQTTKNESENNAAYLQLMQLWYEGTAQGSRNTAGELR